MRPQTSGLPTPNRDGVYFTVTTTSIDDNRKLGRAVRDKDGYFTHIPVAVLGTVTRNMTNYDTESFLNQLRGPSTFNTRLSEGNLISEWNHPFVDLNSSSGMTRLLHLDTTRESNHIRSVSVKRIDDLNLDVVTMDAKGTGPYGKYFDDAMEDPTRNLAFSLRGISKSAYNRSTGVTEKQLVNLVTFDSGVISGGFKEASKRYMASLENLSASERVAAVESGFQFESCEVINKPISPEDLVVIRNIAVESFTDSELNEIMKASRVFVNSVEIGYVDPHTKTVRNPLTGESRSLFHSFMNIKEKR